MPNQITPRKLYIEDLDLTVAPAGATASVNVFGASGNPQTLTKIDMVRFTQFTVADNDTAAAAAGVVVGQIYVTSAGVLMARLV